MKHVLFIPGAGTGAYDADRLLVDALRQSLGQSAQVHYPRMPNEEEPEYTAWKASIATELAALDGQVILVGHSLGGSMLLKFLSEERLEKPIAGLFLIAVPYWNGDGIWSSDELRLPADVAMRLTRIPRIFLYHSRDDEIVPFAHMSRYAAMLPRATIREFDGRGHQFANDLADVAADIAAGSTR